MLVKIFVVYLVFTITSLAKKIEKIELEELERIYEDLLKDPEFDDLRDQNLTDIELLTAQSRFTDPNIIEDALLTCPQLVKKYGYPSETHIVETDDGYLLEMHRIAKPGGIPVLLMHGLLDSSSTWVVMGTKIGFGYMLADLGYDVWMGNVRGNRYSRKHKYLNPDRSSQFWDFSVHEIGLRDIPALIDYVLNNTGQKKLHYIGHSQGSTAFWIMMTGFPRYNNKIISMHALAPVAYTQHCKSPFVRIMTFFLNTLTTLVHFLGVNEFLPNTDFLKIVSQLMCKDGAYTQSICANIIFMICGFNREQLNTTMLPVLLAHAPAGSSTKQFIHFGQLTRSGFFRQYDYGWMQNLVRYKRLSPPAYDLKKVTAKVALHYSNNDWLSVSQDVNRLYKQLPNVIDKYFIPYGRFNHLDFVWAKDVRPFLYEHIVQIMREVENGKK